MQQSLTIHEAAKILRVHDKTLSKLCLQGKFPAHKIGRQWRIDPQDIELTKNTAHTSQRKMPESNGDLWRSTKEKKRGTSALRATDKQYIALLKRQ